MYETIVHNFMPIINAVAGKRQIKGVMTLEVTDKNNGWKMDFESSLPYFKEFFNEINDNTGGKSWGNVRVMHTLKNVGKISEEPVIDLSCKKIYCTVDVTDDKTWAKIENGEYCGFSWSGVKMPPDKHTLSRWAGLPDSKDRYVGRPFELSIVDNPNQPGAYFSLANSAGIPSFEFQKVDGTTELKPFKIKEIEMTLEEIKNAVSTETKTVIENAVKPLIENSVNTNNSNLLTTFKTLIKEAIAEAVTAVKSEFTTEIKNTVAVFDKKLEEIPAPSKVQTKETTDNTASNVNYTSIENSTGVKLTDNDKKILDSINQLTFGKDKK